MKTIIWITLLIILSTDFARAQNNICSSDYNNINENCIRANIDRLKTDSINLGPEITDNVYFYQTASGAVGKLKIFSVVTDRSFKADEIKRGLTECTIYTQSSTFQGNKAFSPDTTLSIRQDFGVWTEDALTLEKNGPHHLYLQRLDNRCILKPEGLKIGFYKKMGEVAVDPDSGNYLLYVFMALVGIAAFLIARSFLEEESKFKAAETMEEAESERKLNPNANIILRYSRPFFKRYLTPVVQRMKNRQNLKTKYRQKLANAGLTRELSPEDFFAFKLFLILGFPIVFMILKVFAFEDWPLKALFVLPFIGFYYPDIWINSTIQNRKDDILRGLPFVVDMLALSVEAGLDFMAAMQKVIDRAPKSAITEEFETLIKDTRIGSSRADGLRQLAFRVDLVQVNSFCSTLIAADSVGASIGPILKQLSAEMRQKRSSDAEKKGATAATKILFPMILFIMPAVFVAIASPIIFDVIGVN